jgi:hypothetical protein
MDSMMILTAYKHLAAPASQRTWMRKTDTPHHLERDSALRFTNHAIPHRDGHALPR